MPTDAQVVADVQKQVAVLTNRVGAAEAKIDQVATKDIGEARSWIADVEISVAAHKWIIICLSAAVLVLGAAVLKITGVL